MEKRYLVKTMNTIRIDVYKRQILFRAAQLVTVALETPRNSASSLSLFRFNACLARLMMPGTSRFVSILLAFNFDVKNHKRISCSLIIRYLFFKN